MPRFAGLCRTYSVSQRVATLIRPIADARAGDASRIAVQAFNENEAVMALRDGSVKLKLIGWHTSPDDFTVTRGAEQQAGTAQLVIGFAAAQARLARVAGALRDAGRGTDAENVGAQMAAAGLFGREAFASHAAAVALGFELR